MRIIGTLLMLLGITVLIVGVVTAFSLSTPAQKILGAFEDGKEMITENIDEVKELFGDVDIVFDKSRRVVEEYEQGEIAGINDDRVRQVLKDVQDVASRSMNLKNEIEDEIDDLEDIKDFIEDDLDSSITIAIISFISLVISGWLFTLGVLFRFVLGRG